MYAGIHSIRSFLFLPHYIKDGVLQHGITRVSLSDSKSDEMFCPRKEMIAVLAAMCCLVYLRYVMWEIIGKGGIGNIHRCRGIFLKRGNISCGFFLCVRLWRGCRRWGKGCVGRTIGILHKNNFRHF